MGLRGGGALRRIEQKRLFDGLLASLLEDSKNRTSVAEALSDVWHLRHD